MIWFMEELLRIEADIKYFVGMKDRSHQRWLMDELLKVLEEAEFLFGPRDRSYELLEPRITERAIGQAFEISPRKMRLYLTSHAKTRSMASYELAHEVVHMLSPVYWGQATMLEEGLGTYFSHKYVKREYGIDYDGVIYPHNYGPALRAVSTLLAKNEFLIKELRVHQPVISKIDETLLVEVAGVEPDLARILCADFETYGGRTPRYRHALF